MEYPGVNDRLIHFLLAEDDDDHAELVLRSLKRNRVANTVDRVANGLEAVEYLHKRDPFQSARTPDVILLDLNMPLMSGHEVLRHVKDDPKLRAIPTVILTTSDAEADRAKAYSEHANSYLVKPMDFTQFAKMVEELSLYWGIWNFPAQRQ